jgi:hypothetical protein
MVPKRREHDSLLMRYDCHDAVDLRQYRAAFYQDLKLANM